MSDQTLAVAKANWADIAESDVEAAKTRLPKNAYLTLVSNHAGLAALEHDWRTLENDPSTVMTVFQSFDWVNAWSSVYTQVQAVADVQVLVGYHNNRLVFVWPLMAHKVQGVRMLSWLTEPFGQYGDVICASDQKAKLWISEALVYLGQFGNFDIIRLRHVRETGALASCAKDLMIDAKLNEKAPFLDLTPFKTEEDYEQRYSSTQRRRRKRIRKKVEAMGPVGFKKLSIGIESDSAIAKAFEEKNMWLADRGRMNRVLGCPGHPAFLKALSQIHNSAVEVVVTELTAGEQAISWEIGFRHRGIHYGYVTSHVNKLTDTSVGRLHMDLSQRGCVTAGLKAYDLMVPYDVHKESWSSGCIATKDYFLPFTWRGWLYGHAYLRHIRPLVRDIYYRLPASVLRWVNPKAALSRSQQRDDAPDES